MSANRPDRRRHARSFAPLVALAILVAACGAPAQSLAPTAVPTPVVTPNPHLGETATAQEVYNGLGRAGLTITPNTAASGTDGDTVITRINATYSDWPLDVYQFRTADDLTAATSEWDTKKGPGRGDPPVALVGLNILVTWGPRTTGGEPKPPDTTQAEALVELVDALELLIFPLRAHTVVPIELASAPVPSADPETTPAP